MSHNFEPNEDPGATLCLRCCGPESGGLRGAGRFGREVLLHPRPTWALAEGRVSTQRAEQPQNSVFQIHHPPKPQQLPKRTERLEEWQISQTLCEELKNGEGFFPKLPLLFSMIFSLWEQVVCPFTLVAHGFFGWIECYVPTTRLYWCFKGVQVMVLALES